MTVEKQDKLARPPHWHLLLRKDVLAGLLFGAVAVLGLYLSRNYPMGTALRMGTGYVPRLLCWLLLALGIIVFLQGLRAGAAELDTAGGQRWRAFVMVPASLVAFALTIERLGIVIATLLLVGIGSLAGRDLRPLELLVAAAVLLAITLGIFVWGLALPIPVWRGGLGGRALRQPCARLWGRPAARQSWLCADRLPRGHAHRRAARHRAGSDGRDASAADLLPRPDLRLDHAR